MCGSDLELRLHFVHTTPNMLQFRRALEKHEEVKTYLELNAQQTHASQAADCDAQDKEILEWIQAAWAEAEEEATREGAPMGELFSQVELTSCMPVDLGDEDSDCEAERLRINLSEEIEEAVKQGFSIVDSEEVVMNPPDDSAFEEVDLSKWETVPERGVENEFDKVSLTTEESIILDDELNIEEVESFTQGSVTLKARDDTVMTDEAEAQEIKQEEQKHAGRPAENHQVLSRLVPRIFQRTMQLLRSSNKPLKETKRRCGWTQMTWLAAFPTRTSTTVVDCFRSPRSSVTFCVDIQWSTISLAHPSTT